MIGRESAEALALRALAHVAAESELLQRFMAMTGAAPADLRSRPDDPALLAAVADFLLSDDRLVTDFARQAGVPAIALAEARAALPGGDVPDWT